MDDFYPRPPRGGRRWCVRASPMSKFNFYPRPPRGGRLYPYEWSCTTHLFLSTPSARRATKTKKPHGRPKQFLSTPSARRATSFRVVWTRPKSNFYPRPPRGGRQKQRQLYQRQADFYPRPPRGGRLIQSRLDETKIEFLSTPSARRATTPQKRRLTGHGKFLSTPSARRATLLGFHLPIQFLISIHALREEGDPRAF